MQTRFSILPSAIFTVARSAVLLEKVRACFARVRLLIERIHTRSILSGNTGEPLSIACAGEEQAYKGEHEQQGNQNTHYLPLSLAPICSISKDMPKRIRNFILLSLRPKPGESLNDGPCGISHCNTGAT